jgi:ribosome-binding factor A
LVIGWESQIANGKSRGTIGDWQFAAGEQIMPTRRQQKVARVLKEAVSDAIANHLNDPRIEGLVSVTRVEMTADLRHADVYLSILGRSDAAQERAYEAIRHARSRIQSLAAGKLRSKFCPVLRLHKDDKFKKTLETMRLIDRAVGELRTGDSPGTEE